MPGWHSNFVSPLILAGSIPDQAVLLCDQLVNGILGNFGLATMAFTVLVKLVALANKSTFNGQDALLRQRFSLRERWR